MKLRTLIVFLIIISLFTSCARNNQSKAGIQPTTLGELAPAVIKDEATSELVGSENTAVNNAPEDRIILTLGCWKTNLHEDEVAAFNNSQDTYWVEVIDYSEGGVRFDFARANLSDYIMSGNAPDMIDITQSFFAFAISYAEDLYPFLDSDPELSRDDFVQSFLKASETDGKLYVLPTHFALDTFIVKASYVDSTEDWSIGKLSAIGTRAGFDKLFFTPLNRTAAFRAVFELAIDDFIDFESGAVNFDSDDYRELLEFAGHFAQELAKNVPDVIDAPIMYAQVSSFHMGEPYDSWAAGDEVIFLGSPCFNSFGGAFSSYTLGSTLGSKIMMSQSCKNKDGAWSFIRYMLSEDCQLSNSLSFISKFFPSNLSAFACLAEMSKNGELETYYFKGSTLPPYDYNEVPKAVINKEIDAINSTTKYSFTYLPNAIETEVEKMAESEAEDFFSGARDIDSVAKSTQKLAEELLKDYLSADEAELRRRLGDPAYYTDDE